MALGKKQTLFSIQIRPPVREGVFHLIQAIIKSASNLMNSRRYLCVKVSDSCKTLTAEILWFSIGGSDPHFF